MTLLEIEEINDNNVYYIFDSKEWHWGMAGGLDNRCKYIKLRINKDDIKIDISVGDKVNVYMVSEYMIVGENAIFETGLINISPIPEKQTNTTSWYNVPTYWYLSEIFWQFHPFYSTSGRTSDTFLDRAILDEKEISHEIKVSVVMELVWVDTKIYS